MSLILKISLASHVILGIIAIIFFYAVWLNLFKQKLNLKLLKFSSLTGLIAFLLSWLTGGYYYVVYYGNAVRPGIKGGQFPWAHTIVMEAKEHIFLFLPFLAAISFIVLWFFGQTIATDAKLKKGLLFINAVIAVIGTAIALSGIIISGAIRQ